ncbi:hypothetical protein [Nocardia carnea]|uniref:hypothetical protein n=1 Tax=Nocardia carnea TaxID=37328 RepID=UPI0024577FF1|nr:hypothetical protein [Nocardia carnea]
MKRAIVLRRPGTDTDHIDKLAARYDLTVVFTVISETAHPRLAVMIAVEHALDHSAEVVVVPWLTAQDIWAGREWLALAEFWVLIGGDGPITAAEFVRP